MPWRIPEEEIERVKRETDLVALVQSRGIELKKHGSKDWKGLCPFHPDKETPNLIVSPDKGLFHCMSCGKAGNAIQFVQHHDGISFRHAFDLLRNGGKAVFTPPGLGSGPVKTGTITRLPCPLDPEADDATLFGQVVAYYHERLKSLSPGMGARAYLASRGLDNQELIDHFKIGVADRSLGLRLPDKNRKEGEKLRTRLMELGLWRKKTGHEHFNGCLIVPLLNEVGQAVSLYGRRLNPGEFKHCYPVGPHQGLFNREACQAPEVIQCEAILDAMTFWVNGFKNVTAIFGTEGFTDELWEAIKRVRTVRIAYDADDAGDRAFERDAKRFQAHGIEVYRIKFPHKMDANEYAQKVKPADKSLALLVTGSAWVGQARSIPAPASLSLAAIVSSSSREAHGVQAPPGAPVSCSQETATKEKIPAPPVPVENPTIIAPTPIPSARLEQRGEHHFLLFENREYRVAGLEKTLGTESLKIALRLSVMGQGPALLHMDIVDLARDQERRRFIERAAEETGLTADLIKRDLGRLLLAVEQAQIELMQPKEKSSLVVQLSPEEREEALAWLKAPDLIARLREAFHKSGIIGEEINTLVSYLACVSRKLERPLAIIIQSASAAGKTTLMEAVLSFFPEEERVKYSAMTGQSLYYLGETNLKHKILAVVEEAGAEKASYALKLLQSEGELTIASTGKDPQSGKMVTHEYRVEGPVMIFLTTTAIDLDEELQNRCLTLAVDESAEQTRRIHQMQRERRTLAGIIAREERKDLLKRLKNAQRLLEPILIHNPYAPDLTFCDERTRHRRDNEKYLTLIESITLLHQHQRERANHEINRQMREMLETTLEDIALANQLAPEVLGRSLDELPPQTRRLLGCIHELLKTKVTNGGAKVGAGSACFTRKQLRETVGWSLTQVTVHLERLVALEYIALRHGRIGSPFVYELLVEIDATEKIAHIGLIDIEQLRALSHSYNGRVSGFEQGGVGKNGQVTGGDKTGPTPSAPLSSNDLNRR